MPGPLSSGRTLPTPVELIRIVFTIEELPTPFRLFLPDACSRSICRCVAQERWRVRTVNGAGCLCLVPLDGRDPSCVVLTVRCCAFVFYFPTPTPCESWTWRRTGNLRLSAHEAVSSRHGGFRRAVAPGELPPGARAGKGGRTPLTSPLGPLDRRALLGCETSPARSSPALLSHSAASGGEGE